MEAGRTETVYDNLNPQFVVTLNATYCFEETQQYMIEVYDNDDAGSKDLRSHQLVGFLNFTLGNLMGSRGALKLTLLKPNGTKLSTLVGITGEEMKDCNDLVHIKFSGVKLDNKDGWFGKSDPFYYVSKMGTDGTFTRVWQSEVIMNNLNPNWRETPIPVGILCNGDHSRPLRIEVFDWEESGSHQLIGNADTNLSLILEGVGKAVPLIHPEKAKKKSYKQSGYLKIDTLTFERRPTLGQFIKGGCEMSLIIAVDYTASNGAPSLPTSLHYQSAMKKNQYQIAIQTIGSVLQEYDHDKRFPTYGYGGEIGGYVNHCFPLTFDPANPECNGIPGVLAAYSNSFKYVNLAGPTNFAPLLLQTLDIVRGVHVSQANQKYFCLLIVTDGCICDMNETIDAIVQLSHCPISIVIVGVGTADFSNMEHLDGDGKLLRGRSGEAMRDIVQFVPFNTIVGTAMPDSITAHAALSKATLAELPQQMLDFFSKKGIRPNTRYVRLLLF